MRRIQTKQIKPIREELLRRQDGKCALCNVPITGDKACLDHDHIDGHVRDVLCRNCNGIEGKVFNLLRRGQRGRGNAWFLDRLIKYWNRHETAQHGIVHPLHKTEDEKRLRANKKARERRAAKKKA